MDGVSRQVLRAPGGALRAPNFIKESVDLPDIAKDSVAQIQILCTFQAGFEVYLVMSRLPAVELL